MFILIPKAPANQDTWGGKALFNRKRFCRKSFHIQHLLCILCCMSYFLSELSLFSKCNCLHYVSVNHMLLCFCPSFFSFFFVSLTQRFFSPFISFSLPPSGFLWREGVKRKKLNLSIEQEVDQSEAFFLIFLCVKKPTLFLIRNAYN